MATTAVETMQNANHIYEMDEMASDTQFLHFCIWAAEFMAVLVIVVFFLQ